MFSYNFPSIVRSRDNFNPYVFWLHFKIIFFAVKQTIT
jgi:hypothetical protein